MKRIFKLLIPASAIGFKAFTSCAVADDQTISRIEIVSPINDITLIQNESYTTDLIEVKCYNGSQQEIKHNVNLCLTLEENKPLPPWIWLNENKIVISNPNDFGIYNFKLYAHTEDKKIRSVDKTFKVNVLPIRHIMPNKIDLSVEDDAWTMYGESTQLTTQILPSREGIDEKYLIKDCKFDVQVLEGKDLDLDNNKLFYFDQNKIESNLLVSSKTDEQYIGKYVVKVTASLIGKPEIQDSKIITIHIDNVYFQKKNEVIYTRESRDDSWTIQRLNPNKQYATEILETLQNKKVTKVAANLCENSKISNLIEINLPKSVVSIGDNAFANQIQLTRVECGGLKIVGENAFYNCCAMSFGYTPDLPKLKIVKDGAFYNCTRVILSGTQDIIKIGKNAFANAGFTTFEIGENCEEIGENAFQNCMNLYQLKILSKKPPILSGGALSQTDKLKSVLVPSESIELYKSDPNWLNCGKTIEGI